jgi:hypothetical protein
MNVLASAAAVAAAVPYRHRRSQLHFLVIAPPQCCSAPSS